MMPDLASPYISFVNTATFSRHRSNGDESDIDDDDDDDDGQSVNQSINLFNQLCTKHEYGTRNDIKYTDRLPDGDDEPNQSFFCDVLARTVSDVSLLVHAFVRTFVKCSCSPLDFTTL